MKNYHMPIIAGGGILLGLFLCALFFYIPKPVLTSLPQSTNLPQSTKEAFINVRGTARPKISIVVFGKEGKPLALAPTNENGDFTVSNLPLAEGVNELTLRAVASKWRVSFPLRILIVRDTTAPAVSINALNEAQVSASGTVISGKAEPGSVVTVNGVQTQAAQDGAWTATVALKPGTNTIGVSATDPAGNTTTNISTIQYTPSTTEATTGTGTATQTSTATSVSPGSQPAPPLAPPTATTSSETTTAPGTNATSSSSETTTVPGTNTTSSSSETTTVPGTITPEPEATATPPPTASGTTAPVPASVSAPAAAPVPAPEPISSIIVSTYVSNLSPNERANETIFATVKDNFGRAVTNASVLASVSFSTGTTNYSLTHQGNGVYTVSFKLNEKYVSGVKVGVRVTSTYKDFSSSATTSFTPL